MESDISWATVTALSLLLVYPTKLTSWNCLISTVSHCVESSLLLDDAADAEISKACYSGPKLIVLGQPLSRVLIRVVAQLCKTAHYIIKHFSVQLIMLSAVI